MKLCAPRERSQNKKAQTISDLSFLLFLLRRSKLTYREVRSVRDTKYGGLNGIDERKKLYTMLIGEL